MKKKAKPICQLHTILDEPIAELSLEKLIGNQESINTDSIMINKDILQAPTSLAEICATLEALDDENSMENFIDKFSSATFTSLDELLANHTTQPYEFQVKAATSEKLFEGLEGLFDE